MSLSRSLATTAATRADAPALIDGSRRYSWRQFAERVQKLAGVFRSLGLTPGGRVALLALNSHRSLEAFFAAIWAGGAIVPLNHRLSGPELAVLVADCSPTLILLGEEFTDQAHQLSEAAGSGAAIIRLGDADSQDGDLQYEALLDAGEPIADAGRSGDDLALLLYTSGTTGAPKGVMLSHANLMANTHNTMADVGLGPDTVHLHHGPLFHVAAAARLFSVTHAGGTHVMLPRFTATEVIEVIAREAVTHATFVPTMIRSLLDTPDLARSDLSSLRLISYGAAPMPEALLDEIMAALPQTHFLQSYGMTELAPVVTILGARDHMRGTGDQGLLRSAGRAVRLSEVRVVGPDDVGLPAGQVGEIVARGPNVMLGYWNRPDLTAEALRGGWMHTGDAGYFNAEGYLFVVDRIKDMIISGGENIYSQEVEDVIGAHPAVAQCAVIGVPDPHWGETVHAVVLFRPQMSASADEIIAHCRNRLAHFKCPRAIHIRNEPMPLSGANKILKTALRSELLKQAKAI
ncbi:long-chain fatty acid--CoA ligase [Sphingopyxis sp. KK2]|uniref:acyl-CoA synthetase n=1 Tax=Sphingopyxis sp. KK2 TaxID=1855727 RepID=UPI00097E73AC|nr:long-chain fatty acid--CoA ligase [Sphingopyxis sp. KK2]